MRSTTDTLRQYEYEMVCCVRGYHVHHVYQEVWWAAVGEDLACDRETSNERDRYAVVVRV